MNGLRTLFPGAAVLSALAALGIAAASPPDGPADAAFAQPAGTAVVQDQGGTAPDAATAERSRALFGRVAEVLTHPRCMNCHPRDDRPRQGAERRVHLLNVVRGPGGRGAPGMRCATCHMEVNNAASGVPGAPDWHLAPLTMGWQGLGVGQICRRLVDRGLNGGFTLAELVEHHAHDPLVGWAWNPGGNREPAPYTQAEFGRLTAEWVRTGAVCPD